MNYHPKEWDESAIVALISGKVKESLSLDYKRCDALDSSDKARAEISKDVSSFANSAGGTVVYGVIEDNNHLPVSLDVGYDPSAVTREWLENIITSTIHPRISSTVITQVELTGSRAGRVLYVVTIPQSVTAHQASDLRYYKRHNFKSQPMEDYEIRDVMSRAQAPDLQVHILRVPCSADGAGHIRLQVSLQNRGRVIAKYASCVCQLLSNSYHIERALSSAQSTWRVDEDRGTSMIFFTPDVGRVVYPELPFSLGYIEWAPNPATFLPNALDVKITVYAEGMHHHTILLSIPTGLPASYEYPVQDFE